jgi:hypothetical protein
MIPPNPNVHSMQDWNGSGVVIPVTRNGKVVSITVNATTTWTANRHPGGGGHYNALGWPGHPAHYNQGYKCPGLNEGCLVVRIRNHGVVLQLAFASPHVVVTPAKISLTFDVPAAINGEIELGINDSIGNLGDNDGILNVLDISWKERQ